MRPDFIVGGGNLWSRYGWVFIILPQILCSLTSSNIYSYSESYMMCYSCSSTRWVLPLVLSIGLMWSYGIWVKKLDWFQFKFMTVNCRFRRNLSWCINILFGVFGYWSMFMIVLKKNFSWWIFIDQNGVLKGHVSNFPSCFISSSLTFLLSNTHPKYFSFRYEVENLLDIWNILYWYCLPICLWTC